MDLLLHGWSEGSEKVCFHGTLCRVYEVWNFREVGRTGRCRLASCKQMGI